MADLSPVTLVLGGARSGKSRFAEELLEGASGERVYLATAEAGDEEMAERIRRHRARRGAEWRTVEEPLDLAGALGREAGPGRSVLVDCLTLWLANTMAAGLEMERETAALLACLPGLAGPVVFVSNEVGQGIVPENALARRFRDEAGRLHQDLAQASDRVFLIVAGLPLTLK